MRQQEVDPVAVLIVEDHHMLAEGLASLLRRSGIETGVVYPSRREDVLDAVDRQRPRLVLLDLDLGLADLSGAALVQSLADAGVRVVLLTGSRDRVALGRCLQAGARGVVSKEAGLAHLIDAVGSALRDEPMRGSDECEELILAAKQEDALHAHRLAPFMLLSRREAGVLRALVDGHSVERVAEQNFVSIATVRSQVRSILLKLGVKSQLAAVAAARQSGWLEETSRQTA